MTDELIRLDTTIIGIDSLINKASTAEEATVLFTAKDVIYSQQRYFTDVQPVNPWLKTSENLDKLQDNRFYLVIHPCYKTPIIAKYHDRTIHVIGCDCNGGYFEFPHYLVLSEFADPILCECRIKYFMELPEMPDDYEEVDSVV